jgi:hypothetical protein
MSAASVNIMVAKAGEKPAADQPAIVLGGLALEIGLAPPPITISGIRAGLIRSTKTPRSI